MVSSKRAEMAQPNDMYSMSEEDTDFKSSPFACSLSTCLYSFCCYGTRHAETLAGAGLRRFWSTFLSFLLLEVLFVETVLVTEDAAETINITIALDLVVVRMLALALIF